MKDEPTKETEVQEKPEVEEETSRREAILKMGKFAAYTAPALLAILASRKAPAGSPPI